MGSGGTSWDTADVLTKARLQQKTNFVGTGTEIAAITTTYAGMVVFCTSTGSGFTINTTYVRNATDAAWITELTALDAAKITTGTMDAARISGVLPIAQGATNISTYTQGDILYSSATDTLAKLAKGTNGQYLKIGATIPAWTTMVSAQQDLATADDDTTSTTFVTSSLSITIANRTGGKFMANASLMLNVAATESVSASIFNDGVTIGNYASKNGDIVGVESASLSCIGDLDGSVIAVYFRSSAGGNAEIKYANGVNLFQISNLAILEVG